jgi:hypothetical protein
MRAATNYFLCSSLVLAFLPACQVFDPDLLPPSDEVETDSGPGPVPSCGRTPPARPDESDPGETMPPMIFAMRDVVLEQSGPGRSWREIGYDLDCYNTRVVTDAVEDGHECVPPTVLAGMPEGGFTIEEPPNVPLDGSEGIDNVFGDVFFNFVDRTVIQAGLLEEGQTFEGEARAAQLAGKGTLLVGVEGWNGQANDRNMTAWIAQAAGGTPCDYVGSVEFNEAFELVCTEITGECTEVGEAAPPPAWEGNDCWWIREDAFVTNSTPPEMKIQDTTAYMADGVAVVRIPPREELLFFAGTVGARVLLTNAVTTAVVEGIGGDPSDLRLVNNIVAGRWATNDLTQSGRHVGVCPGPTQRVLTDQLDGIADVRSDPNDPHGLDLECNAISMGVRFEEGMLGTLAVGETPGESRAPGAALPDYCE